MTTTPPPSSLRMSTLSNSVSIQIPETEPKESNFSGRSFFKNCLGSRNKGNAHCGQNYRNGQGEAKKTKGPYLPLAAGALVFFGGTALTGGYLGPESVQTPLRTTGYAMLVIAAGLTGLRRIDGWHKV